MSLRSYRGRTNTFLLLQPIPWKVPPSDLLLPTCLWVLAYHVTDWYLWISYWGFAADAYASASTCFLIYWTSLIILSSPSLCIIPHCLFLPKEGFYSNMYSNLKSSRKTKSLSPQSLWSTQQRRFGSFHAGRLLVPSLFSMRMLFCM